MTMTRPRWLLVAVAGIALLLAGTGTAWALLGDRDRTTRGTCETAGFELSAERSDGYLEISFDLQSIAPGEEWSIQVEQDGTVLFDGERTTDEDAELDLDVPSAGSDRGSDIRVSAVHADGRTCSASLTG